MNSTNDTNDGSLTVKVLEARSGKARPWHAWVLERNAQYGAAGRMVGTTGYYTTPEAAQAAGEKKKASLEAARAGLARPAAELLDGAQEAA